MTVAELIEKLQQLPPHLPIYHSYFSSPGDGSGWTEYDEVRWVQAEEGNPWPYSKGDLPERVTLS